mgnify:CR=1 FL=1
MSATRSRANPGGMDVLSVLGPDVRPLRERKPQWFKVPPPGGERSRGNGGHGAPFRIARVGPIGFGTRA